jgi:CheY-like chemotaxis protein
MSNTVSRTMNTYKNSQTLAPEGAPPPGPVNSRCRILVVDKNSDLRLLYADALAGPGCRVDLAENGAAAWEALQARHYNLLITENEMPNLTGDELIKKLRSARMDLPVVLVAETWPDHESAENLSLPCAATLWKPFALDALLDTVKNVLRAGVPIGKSPLGLPDNIQGQEPEQDGEFLNSSSNPRTIPLAPLLSPFRSAASAITASTGTEIRLEKMALTMQDGLPVVGDLLQPDKLQAVMETFAAEEPPPKQGAQPAHRKCLT